jgi:predicted RecB family nuclease
VLRQAGMGALLKKVLMYNEDDCVAMLYVEDYLKKAEVFIP